MLMKDFTKVVVNYHDEQKQTMYVDPDIEPNKRMFIPMEKELDCVSIWHFSRNDFDAECKLKDSAKMTQSIINKKFVVSINIYE